MFVLVSVESYDWLACCFPLRQGDRECTACGLALAMLKVVKLTRVGTFGGVV